MSTHQPIVDNSPIVRRVVQSVVDIAHRPLEGLRVLDLGCAHGAYSIEMGRRGANVVGIEARDAWLEIAGKARDEAGLRNVEFVKDDVRNLSRERYGEFDIVLCLGIFYHLDAPAVFDFGWHCADVCRDFMIVETHVADAPERATTWRHRTYHGALAREHQVGTPPEQKLKELGHSIDNDMSFWLTRASLSNLLRHVGFTSVFDVRNPVANLWVGPERQVRMWGNRVTYAAIKGQPVSLHVAPGMTAATEIDWPEDLNAIRYETAPSAASNRVKRALNVLLGRPDQ